MIPVRVKDRIFYGELVCEVGELLHIAIHGYLVTRTKTDIDIRSARRLPKTAKDKPACH